MKKSTKPFIVLSAMLLLQTGCTQEKSVLLHADFKTDKEVYELFEDVVITNTSYAENGRVASSKWEWDRQKAWGIQLENPISFSTIGEHEIKLTISSNVDRQTATCVKTVTVQDNNKAPVADFSYEPATGIRAGDKVIFTDKSFDPDGKIVGWEWTIGTDVITEQNPEHVFAEFGDIAVSLTVEDNMKKKTTKEIRIHVDKSAYSLELVWSKPYESDTESWIKFSSPATDTDGSIVYAFSSGYNLAAYSKDGDHLWTFDASKHNPNPYCEDGSKHGIACTPSVDKDGTAFIALAYNEKDQKSTSHESGVYAINPDGTEKWYFPFGNARYMAVIPAIFPDDLILTTKGNPSASNYPGMWEEYGHLDNGQVLDKATGAFKQTLKVKKGSFGGCAGLSNGLFVTHCNTKYGSRMFFNENGSWKFYGPDDNKSCKSLGYFNGALETGDSGQMAFSKDDKLYIIYQNISGIVDISAFNSVLYCYDPSAYVKDDDTEYRPVWTAGIKGKVGKYDGMGVVCGEDGTIYVTTGDVNDVKARVTAVTSDGKVKWEFKVDGGGIGGSCAVDNQGYIYFNDYVNGKLVKLEPEQGKKVSEIKLCNGEMKSSPTISCDGTIYCNGMNDGLPTLYAVKGSATGHADSWSQLGGNPSKTCVK